VNTFRKRIRRLNQSSLLRVLVALIVLSCTFDSSVVLAIGSRAAPLLQSPVPPQAEAFDAKYSSYVYDVVSIRRYKGDPRGFHPAGDTPDGYYATAAPLLTLIGIFFTGSNHFESSGAPSWLSEEYYDIQAKMEPEVADALHKLSAEDQILARRHMMQVLFRDNLKLVVHSDAKEISGYDLVVAKNGPKLKPSTDSHVAPPDRWRPSSSDGVMAITCRGVSIGSLANHLVLMTGQPVNDKTGLTGAYDFILRYAPDQLTVSPPGLLAPQPDASSLAKALEEQLGLKLVSAKAHKQILIIDHVERPRPD
jgi:uncharacterized protein (TIGR03435 family)